MNPIRSMVGNMGQQRNFANAPQGGAGFNQYAAGKKTYGSGRPMPTMGKIVDKTGYAMRDNKMAARRDALMRRSGAM
jgi:hypothetical protein